MWGVLRGKHKEKRIDTLSSATRRKT